MKLSISYPPLTEKKGVPLLSQNRQFQFFHKPTYIYPIVPAYAATLLDEAGYDVIWDDGIAEAKTYEKWLHDLMKQKPDVVLFETKTPVVKKHWKIISDVKEILPKVKTVLVGDHVTALPRESMSKSKTDYVIEGGDYDFLILNLAKYLEGKEELEPGFWYRENGKIKTSGKFQGNHDLNNLPFINRDLTKWQLYSKKNGNYKETPGTYTMVGRDCWWRSEGGCTFCSWPTLYPNFRTRTPEKLVDEIGTLIEKYKVKEIFDDTGTFPSGNWLRRFCKLMIERGYNNKVRMSANMRFGVLKKDDYRLIRKAGFRMLLFGIESANQLTIDRLQKGTKIDRIISECKTAREQGLEPHITIMVGYPWESRDNALQTVKLAKMLMIKGWAVTLQSTIVIPYPGTRLYSEAKEKGWFRINPDDYNKFDMSVPVLKTPDMEPDDVIMICDDIYKIFLEPRYIFHQLTRMRSWRDVKYSFNGVMKIMGHVRDFGKGN